MIQMAGLRQLMLFFRLLQTAAKNSGEAWVGSAVEYGPYQEFGTQFLMERPHWRVAIPEIVAEVGGSAKLQEEVLDSMFARELAGKGFGGPSGVMGADTSENGPLRIALMIERRVKQIMTSKKIIDTGNYRASVASGTKEAATFEKSQSQALDISTTGGRWSDD